MEAAPADVQFAAEGLAAQFDLRDVVQDQTGQLPDEDILGRAARIVLVDIDRQIPLVPLPQPLAALQQLVDPYDEMRQRERFCDVGIRTAHQPVEHVVHGRLGREHDHRDVAGFEIALHRPAKIHAVHDRHEDIRQDQIDVVAFQDLERLLALGCHDRLVVGPQALGQIVADFGIVLDDEDRLVPVRMGKPLEKGFVHCLVGQVAFDPLLLDRDLLRGVLLGTARQDNLDGRILSRDTVEADLPVMELHQMLDQMQADSASGGFGRI